LELQKILGPAYAGRAAGVSYLYAWTLPILAPITLIVRRFLFSAGLRKNPHRDDHEGRRPQDEISKFRPHRRTAPIGQNDRNNGGRPET
jgi:hypothetical protein